MTCVGWCARLWRCHCACAPRGPWVVWVKDQCHPPHAHPPKVVHSARAAAHVALTSSSGCVSGGRPRFARMSLFRRRRPLHCKYWTLFSFLGLIIVPHLQILRRHAEVCAQKWTIGRKHRWQVTRKLSTRCCPCAPQSYLGRTRRAERCSGSRGLPNAELVWGRFG